MDLKKLLKKLETQKTEATTIGCALPFTKDGKEYWCAYFDIDQPDTGEMEIISYSDSLEDVKTAAEAEWLESYDSFIESLKDEQKHGKEGAKINVSLSGVNGGLAAYASYAALSLGGGPLGALVGGGLFGAGAGVYGYSAISNWRNKKRAEKAVKKTEEFRNVKRNYTLKKFDPQNIDELVYKGAKRMLIELRGEVDRDCFNSYRDLVKGYEQQHGWKDSPGSVSCQKDLAESMTRPGGMKNRAYHIDGIIEIIKRLPKINSDINFEGMEQDEEDAYYRGVYGGMDMPGLIEKLKTQNEKVTAGGQAWTVQRYIEGLFPRLEEIDEKKARIEEAKTGTLYGAPLGTSKEDIVFRMEEELFYLEDTHSRGELIKRRFEEGLTAAGFTGGILGLPMFIGTHSINGYRALKKYGGKIKEGIGKKTSKIEEGFRKVGNGLKDGLTYPYRKIKSYFSESDE